MRRLSKTICEVSAPQRRVIDGTEVCSKVASMAFVTRIPTVYTRQSNSYTFKDLCYTATVPGFVASACNVAILLVEIAISEMYITFDDPSETGTL